MPSSGLPQETATDPPSAAAISHHHLSFEERWIKAHPEDSPLASECAGKNGAHDLAAVPANAPELSSSNRTPEYLKSR
ncbi:diguanylate cyclase [Anopheles sinensis]|uniref:Diguanylate cyclase n=1 Tax=Anopheles sinensis TaxID=74873 RepID=A0A084WAE9_ANOSI|nr:diguanylate cyclase [Anopheles sinensis]